MRKNPVVDKTAGPVPGLAGGSIAYPSGDQGQTMEMPDVDMKTNDGDNPSIGSAAFATGKDTRVPDNQTGANPWPAKPGC
jgi:hypothetical protein